MGAWAFVLPRLANILEELGRDVALPTYVGRSASASPATGLLRVHLEEQIRLVGDALTGRLKTLPQPFRRTAHSKTVRSARADGPSGPVGKARTGG